MDTPVRAVLLDLGGVYYTDGFREGLFSIARKYRLEETRFYESAMELVFATGYVTGEGPEGLFWGKLAQAAGLQTDLYRERGVILSAFKPMAGMADLTLRLRHQMPVGLLTDQTNWLYELDERDGLLSDFDAVINSYEEGYTKREPEIFRVACQRLGIFPEEAIFFDDNAGNVAMGREFGIRSHLFRDVAACETALGMEGVRIL
ncbi:MAG: HAD-IA family hydrolase [bacterium]|nr:MAG: HAD-IA family hydrolase [bacterium]